MNKRERGAAERGRRKVAMIKEQAYEWMDKQIQAHEVQSEKLGDIELCGVSDKEIHVYKGIDKLAKTIEVPLVMKIESGNAYPIEYSLIYRGYKFYQIEKEVLQ